MAQRESGYARQPRDLYSTPAWVTQVLVDDLTALNWVPLPNLGHRGVWEPAAGNRAMADVLAAAGWSVTATDIEASYNVKQLNFLTEDYRPLNTKHIITNPPYDCPTGDAMAFIRRGLDIIREIDGTMALLLPVDFDSAKTRADVFGKCQQFKRKVVLTDRIEWFDRGPENAAIKARNVLARKVGAKPEKLIAGPSANHCWFIWRAYHDMMTPRTLGYGGKPVKAKAAKQRALEMA